MELIDKFIDLGGIGELINGTEMMIEISPRIEEQFLFKELYKDTTFI